MKGAAGDFLAGFTVTSPIVNRAVLQASNRAIASASVCTAAYDSASSVSVAWLAK